MLLLFLACTSTSDPLPKDSASPDDSPNTTDSDPPENTESSPTTSDSEEETRLTFLSPGATAENPVSFLVDASADIVRVAYYAEETWLLGESTDAAGGFPLTYTFTTLGTRAIDAHGYDADGVEVARADTSTTVSDPPGEACLGVWLWYIEGIGSTHEALAQQLADLGVCRIYIKVADGGPDCGTWPELCDDTVPATYQSYGLEAWAWSYNYPGSSSTQAEALRDAVATGYQGYVLDLESEFDGETSTLTSLLSAFKTARDSVSSAADFPIYVTTWGNPNDHGMRVDLMDSYVEAFMPQTYLEVWGSSYMADPEYWVEAGTCEFRSLGATKPVHHILSTEYDEISSDQLDRAILTSGPETSIWRVPGGGTPTSIWNTWEDINWSQSSFADEPDCN